MTQITRDRIVHYRANGKTVYRQLDTAAINEAGELEVNINQPNYARYAKTN